MRFKIVECGTDRVVHGMLNITLENCYISAYPRISGKPPKDLAVGEHVEAVYSLSGQKPTAYWIVRTE
jgi:hypothetical protein